MSLKFNRAEDITPFDDLEKEYLEKAYSLEPNISKLARLVKKRRNWLYRRFKRYGIPCGLEVKHSMQAKSLPLFIASAQGNETYYAAVSAGTEQEAKLSFISMLKLAKLTDGGINVTVKPADGYRMAGRVADRLIFRRNKADFRCSVIPLYAGDLPVVSYETPMEFESWLESPYCEEWLENSND